MNMKWKENTSAIYSLLDSLSVRDELGREIGPEKGFERWIDLASQLREARGVIFLIGNGASASMASHMAADVAKNAGIRTEVFYDLSLLTALGNDIGFEYVFAEPINLKMSRNDMLVAISSSGESPNIIKGVEAAVRIGGQVVTLSAMNPENRLRLSGILNFYLPAVTYGLAETCHAAVLHHWMDRLAEKSE